MIKRPSLRVSSFADVADEVKAELLADLEHLQDILPFTILEFEIIGSAARGDWQFHSDLDINLRTGDGWMPNGALWRIDTEKTREASNYIRSLYNKWGIRIEVSTESASIADLPYKACWALREGVGYHLDQTVRVDVDPVTGTVVPREWTAPNPKYGWSWFDNNGDQHFNEERYPAEVQMWRTRYGEKFLEIGDTPDTAYLLEP